MSREIVWTSKFKKDYKAIIKHTLNTTIYCLFFQEQELTVICFNRARKLALFLFSFNYELRITNYELN